jgi:hypothetical protein
VQALLEAGAPTSYSGQTGDAAIDALLAAVIPASLLGP